MPQYKFLVGLRERATPDIVKELEEIGKVTMINPIECYVLVDEGSHRDATSKLDKKRYISSWFDEGAIGTLSNMFEMANNVQPSIERYENDKKK